MHSLVDYRLPVALEKALSIGLMMWYTGAIVPPLVLVGLDPTAPQDPVLAESGLRLLRLLWLPIYALLFLVSAPFALTMLQRARSLFWLFPLLVLPILSIMWSISPETTVRRSVALWLTTWFGLYLAVRWTQRDFLRLLGTCFGILLVLSALVSLILPELGQMSGVLEGNWRGVFTHKNHLGRFAVLGSLVFLVVPLAPRKRLVLVPLALALSLSLLLMSDSVSAVIAAFLLLSSYGVFRIFDLGPIHAPGPLLLVAALALVGVFVLGPLAGTLVEGIGRDSTLTGRTALWGVLWDSIQQRPWLGYGYGAFWITEFGPVYDVRRAIDWATPSAHNGFIDLCLSLGFVGLTAFALAFAWVFARALRASFLPNGTTRFWGPLYLLSYIVLSLTEDRILQQSDLAWAIFVAVAAGQLRTSTEFALEAADRPTETPQTNQPDR
ncbi:MAG: O-antigen ligase family protein [Myxococcales bacterium]|nr:O-antigen ligase family protein [Myxococcales bacterium]